MRIILGGYFETALVRYADQVIRPDRNFTGHSYYMCVNRRVAKPYFDRAATFVALAQEVIIPSVDWSLPPGGDGPLELSRDRLGISLNSEEQFGGREWDEDTKIFAHALIQNRALSREAWMHASTVDFARLERENRRVPEDEKAQIRRGIAEHYLCRLFLQVRATAQAGALLTLSEQDINILQDVGNFLLQTGMPSPFAFPDLTGKVINGDEFAAGLLNFSPPDALALAAVKDDPVVRRYVNRIVPFMRETGSPDGQRNLLRAMHEAQERAEAGRRAEKVFEVASWCVKPLHYVPGLGEALSLAEDAKDLVGKWIDRESEAKEWYLLGAKMADISIRDYLARKSNQPS